MKIISFVTAVAIAGLYSTRATLAQECKADIDALYAWTCEQGRENRLQGAGAELLGLNTGADVPALRKAYQDDVTRTIYAFNIVMIKAARQTVMFRLTNQLSALWLVSQEGRISKAAEVTATGMRQVPAERHYNYFIETKDYLLNERSKAVADKPLTGKCLPIPTG